MQYTIFWFRRDLRLEDNAGLYRALTQQQNVLPLFIFDENILSKIEDRNDARVTFIHEAVTNLKQKLQELGTDIIVKYGTPLDVWSDLVNSYNITSVYTNHDFEPYAQERDNAVATLLQQNNINFHTFKDHVIFEKNEVTKDDGKPYTVFTPYSKKWLAKLQSRTAEYIKQDGENATISFYLKPYPTAKYFQHFAKIEGQDASMPSLDSMGFATSTITFPSKTVAMGIIKNYDKTRDFPALIGTSRLGIHFRFGTISVREKALKALFLNQTYLNELIWRDFYAQILYHFPHVAKNAFRKEYDKIQWRNDITDFEKWCNGMTGYPIVDAGMRELNQTGYMHNRVRMIVASFLTKHLLIDWRWGEAYFAKKLLDFDLASNSGGWQWAAGCGTDAAPYFRIFNPTEQTKKFDKDLIYIKKWIPELNSFRYPAPIVEHKFARERCLTTYKIGLEK